MSDALVRVDGNTVYANQRLYFTEDGSIVAESVPEGRYLAYPEGEEIPAEVAKEQGLVKSAAKPRDKAVKAPENK